MALDVVVVIICNPICSVLDLGQERRRDGLVGCRRLWSTSRIAGLGGASRLGCVLSLLAGFSRFSLASRLATPANSLGDQGRAGSLRHPGLQSFGEGE